MLNNRVINRILWIVIIGVVLLLFVGNGIVVDWNMDVLLDSSDFVN